MEPTLTAPSDAPPRPHLRRVLGRWDLALLIVVAVTNINVVPVTAAGGAVTVWLWILALLLFFFPQGIAVIELSQRYPGEGGVYLWTKRQFGDFHGFISGWCYWTNNVFYVPSVLLYLVSNSVYIAGPRFQLLGENRLFSFIFLFALLWFLVAVNVVGLGVGKWVNNLGGVSTFLATAVLIVLGTALVRMHGTGLSAADFHVAGADWHTISAFGVICFSLVGIELGLTMGDEIRDPERNVPVAVVWGGVLSGLLYVAVTLTVLVALPPKQVGVVQGIMQAITGMAGAVGALPLVAPLAALLCVAVLGTGSAWLAGSARIPFVAGLDRYLPSSLGRVHPRFATPYVALLTHGVLSSLFMTMSFVRASVQEAYLTMLDLAVVLQLVPFLYMYAALLRLATAGSIDKARYSRMTLWLAGASGFATTTLGMLVAFVPSRQIKSVGLFELKMALGCAFFLALGWGFFYVNSARKEQRTLSLMRAKQG